MKFLLNAIKEKEAVSLPLQYTGLVRFVPLLLAGGFFATTIFLYAFGPLDWNVVNPEKIYPFLISCLIALIAGYMCSVIKGTARQLSSKVDAGIMLTIGCVVSLVLLFPLSKVTTGNWIPDVYRGITNTGAAYQITKYYSVYAPKAIFYVRILLSPVVFVVTPLTLIYWKKLSITCKVLGVISIVMSVALGIAQGVNKHFADIVMQLVLILSLFLFAKVDGSRKKRWIYRIRIMILIFVICATFLFYYSNSMRNRVAMDTYDGNIEELLEEDTMGEDSNDPSKVLEEELKVEIDEETLESALDTYATFSVAVEKENSLWQVIIPEKLQSIVNYLTSYFCHGYTGLSMAMEEDFTSSYGLGFSEFLRHNISRFHPEPNFENEIYERTYMSKIARHYGWETGPVWSSFFIFPASDISFPGTVFMVFLIGFLFGLSWKDTLEGNNPLAAVVFFGFVTMVFFFSANNQMFQGGENFIAFTSFLFLWLGSRWFSSRKSNGNNV